MLSLVSGTGLYAEFGANVLLGSNYKADFGLKAGTYSAADPGAETGIQDRTYDDGYNLVDATGNFDRGTGSPKTYYWGYQDASQYDAAGDTITMTSERIVLSDNGRVSINEHHAQPGLEFWWQETFFSGVRDAPYQPRNPRENRWLWYADIRAAVRWQHIELSQNGNVSGSLESVSDVYSTGGATPPTAPFDGTFEGPNMVLDAVPMSRTVTPVGSGSARATYDLSTDLIALDVGPALIFDLSYGARFSVSAGGSLAWAYSEFDYRYGDLGRGESTDSEALWGWYAGFDFLFAEQMTLGFITYQLQDLEHNSGNSFARLDFSGNYTFRIGLRF